MDPRLRGDSAKAVTYSGGWYDSLESKWPGQTRPFWNPLRFGGAAYQEKLNL
jgi:hypothetical protein